MKRVLLSMGIMIVLSACSPIQETYKPLYQATPEKHAIEGN
nr:hypothetical protein [Sulfurimonas sp. MAG313]